MASLNLLESDAVPQKILPFPTKAFANPVALEVGAVDDGELGVETGVVAGALALEGRHWE